jgi:uncharacterized LabA/DUF88 family protein
MNSMGRAAVFIDNGYLQKVLRKELFKARINYLDFSNNICSANNCYREITFVFDGKPYLPNNATSDERKNHAGRMKVLEDLSKLDRFVLKLGKQIPLYDDGYRIIDYVQKGVDVLLAMEMIFVSMNPDKPYDKIILVSGDGDFVPAVNFAHSRGMEVVLYHSNDQDPRRRYSRVSYDLLNACKKCHAIDASLVNSCTII